MESILQVPEGQWEVYGEPHPQEIRECAAIDFVPGEKSEHKDTKPLRYVAIRIRPRQEALFSDGSKVKHFAIVSNLWEWKPGRLIQWHREKAGTMPAGKEKDALLKRLRSVDTAADLDRQLTPESR